MTCHNNPSDLATIRSDDVDVTVAVEVAVDVAVAVEVEVGTK